MHFLIAKYSFKHPELFLHHWGKPFFTLISSPFAQFGFVGIALFNTLCATLTGFIIYRICKQLQTANEWIAPLFALFTPIYYVVIISGLTEIFFGLILSASVLLFVKKYYRIGSILISFLPFIRSEGYILLPLFAFILIYNKNWKKLFFLGTGFIIYSTVGYFYFHDLFWVISQNPYNGARDIYGSGSLFWFISKNEFLLGTPLVVLLGLGFFSYLTRSNNSSLEEKILIVCGFSIYFIAHSIFWWKGIFGSLGLIRVIAAVAPLSAIIALRGFNLLISYCRNNLLKKIITGLISWLVLFIPFKQHQFPRPLDNEGTVTKETADWIKEAELNNRRAFALGPYISFFLDKDPFNSEEMMGLWRSGVENSRKGDIIIWDSHFAPLEGRVPLNIFIENSSSYKFLKKFRENGSGEKLFEIYVFERL